MMRYSVQSRDLVQFRNSYKWEWYLKKIPKYFELELFPDMYF